MRKLQNLKIMMFFIMALIIGLGQFLMSQEPSKVNKEVKTMGNSQSSTKQKIPNWENNGPDNNKKELIQKHSSVNEDMPNKSSSLGGNGIFKLNSQTQQFMEDPQKPGHPIGWITNSDTPILTKHESQTYIELSEFQSDVYLGKYIKVPQNSRCQLVLSFDNIGDVRLNIIEYDEFNKNNLDPKTFILPKGKFRQYTIDTDIAKTTQNMFIKFKKESNGKFILDYFNYKEIEQ